MRITLVDWLSFGSLLLAIIALGLAMIQLLDARRQAKGLERQGQALTFVTNSLSTRYIGPFPDWQRGLSDLIDSAKRELRVLSANPAPGYFTDPANFMSIRHAI